LADVDTLTGHHHNMSSPEYIATQKLKSDENFDESFLKILRVITPKIHV
jgi:hypothetical protein